MAWVYESLGQLYSGGKIYVAKASQIQEMRRGDAVLYVGVGPGEDAVLAGQLGAEVTCIDIAPKMLHKVEKRFLAAGATVGLVCGDVLTYNPSEKYDVVVVNFFLNVFAERPMQAMLTHLATLVKPGGKLLISDFASPHGGWIARKFQAWYWGVTNLFYYLLGLCAWHPIYDYPNYFEPAGLVLHGVQTFRVGRFGPRGFSAITAMRRLVSGPTPVPTST
jgi:ubiquinone/menaquinone biosynthesis C-methylase UbiE